MLYKLYTEIINKTYKALPSRVFVIKKPVLREIFAPQFRDRVVHHLIYNYIYQYLDKKFIYDSYSCREGKGTLFGIERAKRFMRKASHNYTRDAYVLKLDIRGYFMNINRKKLYEQLQNIINYESLLITHQEKACLQYLIREICLHNAAEGAQRCSPFAYWDGIPASKSLFCTPPDCGLPIGSLTSQLFSNVYMNDIDHQIKACFKYYGRYVDDMLLIDRDKEKLQWAIGQIDAWLSEIGLSLHPQKIYLKHYTQGFYFLGQYIKPNRTYISRRFKKHFNTFLEELSLFFAQKEEQIEMKGLLAVENTLNSYLSVLSKANTYRYVTKILGALPKLLWNYMDLVEMEKQFKIQIKSSYKKQKSLCLSW